MTLSFRRLAALSAKSNIYEFDMEPLPGLSSLGRAGMAPRLPDMAVAFLTKARPSSSKKGYSWLPVTLASLVAWNQSYGVSQPAVPTGSCPRAQLCLRGRESCPGHRRG